MEPQTISRVLVSVFHKKGLAPLLHTLAGIGAEFIATGGTQKYIEEQGHRVQPAEEVTGYPSIFGGRVKTLHPALMGGILFRRNHPEDARQARRHGIKPVDMVIVDLYPAAETIAQGKELEAVIEKIDIGGVTLIRAAAKNYDYVLTVSSRNQYERINHLLKEKKGYTNKEDRAQYAAQAFALTADYDACIGDYLGKRQRPADYRVYAAQSRPLRYGENPHQQGVYHGNFDDLLEQLNGDELSYNNFLDIDAALRLIEEFEGHTAMGIVKHNNACGLATGASVREAYEKALQADPLSAFGGVLAANRPIDSHAATRINELFFDTLIAPGYEKEALSVLRSKKKRKILKQKRMLRSGVQFRTVLDGMLEQNIDSRIETANQLTCVTRRTPSQKEINAMLFANKIVKHTRSNAIVLAAEGQLIASGVGQTSRVDALRQALAKAKRFKLDIAPAAMASDAFFPFPDCVEIARREGIRAVIQPGGSIRDQASIDFCNAHDMAMVTTGIRHFKH